MRGLKRLAVTALILAGATPVTAQSPVWVDYQSGSGVIVCSMIYLLVAWKT